MALPPNFVGEYANGGYYSLGQVVLTSAGSPYGIPGYYWIRVSDPGNPGYPPGSFRWEIYVMPKGIDGAGSLTGSGNIY
jgi:hypothetical protein